MPWASTASDAFGIIYKKKNRASILVTFYDKIFREIKFHSLIFKYSKK